MLLESPWTRAETTSWPILFELPRPHHIEVIKLLEKWQWPQSKNKHRQQLKHQKENRFKLRLLEGCRHL